MSFPGVLELSIVSDLGSGVMGSDTEFNIFDYSCICRKVELLFLFGVIDVGVMILFF